MNLLDAMLLAEGVHCAHNIIYSKKGKDKAESIYVGVVVVVVVVR